MSSYYSEKNVFNRSILTWNKQMNFNKNCRLPHLKRVENFKTLMVS